MGIDWNRGEWEKERIASRMEQEGWIWEPMKIDRRGRAYSAAGERGGKIATILRQEVYQCAFCKGTGEKPRGAKCSVCTGKGQVSIQPPVIVCTYCKGTGEEHPRTNITCTVCKGKGFVSIIEPIGECPHCRGTGAEPTNKLPCLVCGGKGVITLKEKYRESRSTKTPFQSSPSGDLSTKESVKTGGWPSGSEREVLEITHELDETTRAVIGRRMGVSPAYAEHLCNSLIKGGYLTRTSRGLFTLTRRGKEALPRKGV